jgi:hypothetical protein
LQSGLACDDEPFGSRGSVCSQPYNVDAWRQVGGVVADFVAAGGGGDAHRGRYEPTREVVERELCVFRALWQVVTEGHLTARRAGVGGVEGESVGVRSRPGGLHGTEAPGGAVGQRSFEGVEVGNVGFGVLVQVAVKGVTRENIM